MRGDGIEKTGRTGRLTTIRITQRQPAIGFERIHPLSTVVRLQPQQAALPAPLALFAEAVAAGAGEEGFQQLVARLQAVAIEDQAGVDAIAIRARQQSLPGQCPVRIGGALIFRMRWIDRRRFAAAGEGQRQQQAQRQGAPDGYHPVIVPHPRRLRTRGRDSCAPTFPVMTGPPSGHNT